jgi:hypothetical protein
MSAFSFKDALIELQGRKFSGIDETQVYQEIGRPGSIELTFNNERDRDAFVEAWQPGCIFSVDQRLNDDDGNSVELKFKSCLAIAERGLTIEASFLDLEIKRTAAASPSICECGSGSNVRGPGHSSYCRLLEG